MSQAAIVAESRWIVGPRFDLAFFSTVWLPPLLVLGAAGFAGLQVGIGFFILWIYHLFIRLPHFAMMFRVTYLSPSQIPYYREHWIQYFAIPALIVLVYAAPLATPDGYQSPFGFAIETIAYLWGYQHIGMQNYGVMQVYRIRRGAAAEGGRRLEKAIFYAIIASVCAANHLIPATEFVSGIRLTASTLSAVNLGLLAVAAAGIAFYFLQLWRDGALGTPAVLYFTVSVVAMVKWPFYDDLPPNSWFLVFNGHHSVAYLGLLFLMIWNEKNPDQPMTFRTGAREYLKLFWPLVGFSLLLILVAAVYNTTRLDAGYGPPGSGSLEVLLGFFVAHYYVDARVWRFRNAHIRATTLPLLRRPGPHRRSG